MQKATKLNTKILNKYISFKINRSGQEPATKWPKN